ETLWAQGDDGRRRDPWQFTNELGLSTRDGSETYLFVTTSRGGINALGSLSREYGKHIRQKPGELPIIALDGDSYQHRIKAYGAVRVPVLRVVDWLKAPEASGQTLPKRGPMDDEIP